MKPPTLETSGSMQRRWDTHSSPRSQTTKRRRWPLSRKHRVSVKCCDQISPAMQRRKTPKTMSPNVVGARQSLSVHLLRTIFLLHHCKFRRDPQVFGSLCTFHKDLQASALQSDPLLVITAPNGTPSTATHCPINRTFTLLSERLDHSKRQRAKAWRLPTRHCGEVPRYTTRFPRSTTPSTSSKTHHSRRCRIVLRVMILQACAGTMSHDPLETLQACLVARALRTLADSRLRLHRRVYTPRARLHGKCPISTRSLVWMPMFLTKVWRTTKRSSCQGCGKMPLVRQLARNS